MLLEFITKTIEIGGNALEIECDEGREWIFALDEQGRTGTSISIGSLKSNSKEWEQLYKEMQALKKKKQVTVQGVKYRLVFSKYENFGEWTYKIAVKKAVGS